MAVPEHFFDESWRKGNFLLPTDEVARKELWKQLDDSTRCGASAKQREHEDRTAGPHQGNRGV